jgi:hypothetical protein
MRAPAPVLTVATAGTDFTWTLAVDADGRVVRWVGDDGRPVGVAPGVEAPASVAAGDQWWRLLWRDAEGGLWFQAAGSGPEGPVARRPVPTAAPVEALGLSPSGGHAVLACADGRLHRVDPMTGTADAAMATRAGEVRALAVASDARTVAVAFADGSVRRYDFDTSTSTVVGVGPPLSSLAVSADGGAVITATAAGEVSRWDVATGSSRTALTLAAEVTALAVDPAAEFAVVGLADGRLQRHDLTGDLPVHPYLVPPVAGATVDEDVRFTVYRPRGLRPGRWSSMLVFAHKTDLIVDPDRGPIDPTETVSRRATAFFGGTQVPPVAADASTGLALGARLRIVPDLPGVRCNPPVAEVEWLEPVHETQFRLLAGPELDGARVRGAVRVWCGPLIVAEVSLTVPVSAAKDVDPTPAAEPLARYRRIFPSYSHDDTDVVARFGDAARALGDDFLQDVLTLRAGEQWSPRLLELIESADVFQLFWSSNSMRSTYCREEWEHALALGRPSFVRPVYWEDPLPQEPGLGLPPDGLLALHFVKVPVVRPPTAVAEPGRCMNCGQLNEPTAQFCGSCGSYLGWAQERNTTVAEPEVRVGPPAPPPASAPQRPMPAPSTSPPTWDQPVPSRRTESATRSPGGPSVVAVVLVLVAVTSAVALLIWWLAAG